VERHGCKRGARNGGAGTKLQEWKPLGNPRHLRREQTGRSGGERAIGGASVSEERGEGGAGRSQHGAHCVWLVLQKFGRDVGFGRD